MQKKNIKIIAAGLFIVGLVIFLLIDVRPVLIGKKIILVEVADNTAERTKGLQNRTLLPENRGMLFCFEKEMYPHFWMKDTLLPLDIAFISSDKRIVDIQHMKALDEKLRYVPKNKAKYALEANSGWFERYGVSVGDRLFFWK